MLYPRLIEIRRAKTVAGAADDVIGLTGYSGVEQSTDPADPRGETVLYTDVPANIQAGPAGHRQGSGLPQDAVSNPTWFIYLPITAPLPPDAICDRDIVVDDRQYRYQVGQDYCNILGWKLMCIRLEA